MHKNLSIRPLGANRVLVSRPGFMTPDLVTHEIALPDDVTFVTFATDVEAWRAGAFIQNALSYVHREDREFLMTGCTPKEWNEIYPDDTDIWDITDGGADSEGI